MAVRLSIHDIRDTKSAQIQAQINLVAQDLDLPSEQGVSWQPMTFTYTLTNADNLFLLQGQVIGTVALECSLCLKPVEHPLEITVNEEFSRLPTEDDEVHVFKGDEINVAGVLREHILLNLPPKPVCTSDCRGLCPHCGGDRNLVNCNCDPKTVDPRLAVLEKLLPKSGGGKSGST